jgi:hypothetical protein
VNVILLLKRYFVNVVECSSGLPRQKENAKEKGEEKEIRITDSIGVPSAV